MDSISLPISNSSLSLGSSGKDGSQDQDQRTVAECLNELENELERLVPWSCPNRLKVILGRIAMKVQKDKPTPGKIYYSDKWLFWGYDYKYLKNYMVTLFLFSFLRGTIGSCEDIVQHIHKTSYFEGVDIIVWCK